MRGHQGPCTHIGVRKIDCFIVLIREASTGLSARTQLEKRPSAYPGVDSSAGIVGASRERLASADRIRVEGVARDSFADLVHAAQEVAQQT